MKKVVLLLITLCSIYQGIAQLPNVSAGTIKRFENFSSQYVEARNVDVWLPADYSSKYKYNVLYMHDGQMLFDSTTTWNKQEWGVDETISKLMVDNQIKRCIVVAVWNNATKRHLDYFPQKPFESLSTTEQERLYNAQRSSAVKVFSGKIQSDNYLKFLVTELKPFIDSNFSTYKSKQHTFIAGSSMGGLISMYAICEYPKIFGGAACLSTHWLGVFDNENNPIPQAFVDYMRLHLPSPRQHKIYFDYGTATLDAYYPPLQAKVDEVMRQKGYTAKNWITKAFPNEDHSERAWRSRLHIPLLFLLAKDKK